MTHSVQSALIRSRLCAAILTGATIVCFGMPGMAQYSPTMRAPAAYSNCCTQIVARSIRKRKRVFKAERGITAISGRHLDTHMETSASRRGSRSRFSRAANQR